MTCLETCGFVFLAHIFYPEKHLAKWDVSFLQYGVSKCNAINQICANMNSESKGGM